MKHGWINKLKLLGLITITSLCLTGCDDMDACFDNYRDTLTAVQARNQDVIEEFFDAGLITSDEKAAIQKSIKDKLTSMANLNDDSELDVLRTCVVNVMTTIETETKDDGKEYVKGTNLTTDKAAKLKLLTGHHKEFIKNGTGKNPSVKGLELMDESSLTYISNALNKDIYKLKNITPEQFNEVLVILKTLEKTPITDAASSEKLRQMLDPYFENSGEKVFDIKNNQLIKETVAGAKLGDEGYQNGLGKDVAVLSDGVVTLTVRIKELTSDAVKEVTGSNYNTDKKYLVVDKKNGETVGRAYLMEYPVDEITDIRLGKPGESGATLDTTSWWCDTNWDPDRDGTASKDEDNKKLRVNLLNGQIINTDNSVLNKNTAEEDNIYRLNTKTPSFGVYNPIKRVKKIEIKRKDTGEIVPIENVVFPSNTAASLQTGVARASLSEEDTVYMSTTGLLNGSVATNPMDTMNGGSSNNSGKTNTVLTPDGIGTQYPNGDIVLEDGTTIKPDGTKILPDDTVIYPDGTKLLPDGTIIESDGTKILPDGTTVYSNGNKELPDGTMIYPNGDKTLPDGTIVKNDENANKGSNSSGGNSSSGSSGGSSSGSSSSGNGSSGNSSSGNGSSVPNPTDFSSVIQNAIAKQKEAALLKLIESGVNVEGLKDKDGNELTVEVIEEMKQDTSVTRIYLKDYLELTYMPGVVMNEPFIATGRRIKINKIFGDKEDIDNFGVFIDKKGNEIADIEKLSLYDVVDYQSGSDGYYANVAEKLGLGNNNSEEVATDLAKSKDERVTHLRDLAGKGGNGTNSDGMVNSENDQILYSDVYFNWIRPAIQFGNNSRTEEKPLLNMADANKVDKGTVIRMVGLCVNTSMFKTNLFTSWINVNGSGGDVGSLEWWNDWLGANGFTYRIDKDTLLSMIQNNYKSQMADAGYIVFDIDTVGFIQEQMDTDRVTGIKTNLFTLSKLVGFLFISYSILLLGAWVFDVNITNGPDLLGKISANRWEAISSVSEAPYVNSDEKQYMDLRSIIIKAFIVMAIGVVLLFIDIVTLRDLLVNFIDNFTKIFQNVLHNK